jgi:hypothetical protein
MYILKKLKTAVTIGGLKQRKLYVITVQPNGRVGPFAADGIPPDDLEPTFSSLIDMARV